MIGNIKEWLGNISAVTRILCSSHDWLSIGSATDHNNTGHLNNKNKKFALRIGLRLAMFGFLEEEIFQIYLVGLNIFPIGETRRDDRASRKRRAWYFRRGQR